MLWNLDLYAEVFLKRRAARGVNRLRPILPTHPPHDTVASVAAPAPLPCDTS
jgi:hypothetical protein